jgi:hypothetical protein
MGKPVVVKNQKHACMSKPLVSQCRGEASARRSSGATVSWILKPYKATSKLIEGTTGMASAGARG